MLAMEERNLRENLQGKAEDLEDRVQTQRDELERLRMERDTQTQTVDGLQRALQDLQDGTESRLRDFQINTLCRWLINHSDSPQKGASRSCRIITIST